MALLSPARSGVRVLQAASAIVAIIFTSLGYIEFDYGQLSSGAAIYSTIANYSAALCALFYAVGLGSPLQAKLSLRAPKIWHQRVVDLVFVIALVLAGALHATSTAVKECTSYNELFATYHGSNLFRCGNMTAGIVFTFITAGLFLATIAWSFARDSAAATSLAKTNTLAAEEQPSATREYAAVATPGAAVVSKALVEDAEARRPLLRTARRSGRVLQLASSLVALVAMVLGYRHYFTGQYLSPKATFVILMAYTCMAYSLWHVLAVETLQLARRPALSVERVVDGVLAVVLLVAGVVFVSSTAVADCSANNAEFEKYHAATLFRCGSMTLGSVFSFVAVLTYFLTFAITFLYGGEVRGAETSADQSTVNGDAAERV